MKVKWSMLLCAVPLLAGVAAPQQAWADQSTGFGCPPSGDPYDVVRCYDDKGNLKPGFPKKTPKPFDGGEDVNGDGKKDRLGSSSTDAKGNTIECWCLQKSPQTPQQFAYAFVPKGGTRKWFGGCYFPNGQNDVKCEGEVVKNGPDKGKFAEYTKVSQDNNDWGPSRKMAPTGTQDKHFCYFNSGPNKGKIQKSITEGHWVKISDSPPDWRYETTKTTPCPVKDPPATPQELLAQVFTATDVVAVASSDGVTMDLQDMLEVDSADLQAVLAPSPSSVPLAADAPFDFNDPAMIAALGDFSGTDFPRAAVIVNTDALPNWQYRLLIPPTVTGFDDTDPDAGFLTQPNVSIHVGDEFTLTGVGIQAASVSAEAARPQVGGWVLTEFDAEHASFRATVNATPPVGVPFGPFTLVSGAAVGTTRWAYRGGDVGMSAETLGPSN